MQDFFACPSNDQQETRLEPHNRSGSLTGRRASRSPFLPSSRVVMFIVDGLRYDFLAPHPDCCYYSSSDCEAKEKEGYDRDNSSCSSSNSSTSSSIGGSVMCSPSYNRFRNMHRMLSNRDPSTGVSNYASKQCHSTSSSGNISSSSNTSSSSRCTSTRARSMLFRYRADAPTVTAQRLRGMFAGTIPAFVEMGTNFNAHVIEEDSFIHQMKQAGKR